MFIRFIQMKKIIPKGKNMSQICNFILLLGFVSFSLNAADAVLKQRQDLAVNQMEFISGSIYDCLMNLYNGDFNKEYFQVSPDGITEINLDPNSDESATRLDLNIRNCANNPDCFSEVNKMGARPFFSYTSDKTGLNKIDRGHEKIITGYKVSTWLANTCTLQMEKLGGGTKFKLAGTTCEFDSRDKKRPYLNCVTESFKQE